MTFGMSMFAKLKKKIQDEGSASPGGGESAEFGARLGRLPSPGPGIASPVKPEFPGGASPFRRESSYSKDMETMSISSEISDVKDTASKEDMLKKILKKNEQIKKLETKITEIAAMIKDRNKNIEKLEKSIEKQKEESDKKIEELTSNYEIKRKKFAEEGSGELKLKLRKLEEEKEDLKGKLTMAGEYRQKYLNQEEAAEELSGLATQEMAKIKHMLLNTQDELSVSKSELDTSQEKTKQLDNEVQSLMQQITSLTSRSDELEEENKVMKDNLEKLHNVEAEFTHKNDELRSRSEELEKIQHSYDVLHRNSDMHQNKMSKLVEEKDEHISHMRERIQTLEQRLKDGELSGDDRMQALEKEREVLEQKLTETREQLTQVKSTWSDKISHLEEQISHLNNKITEDNEELMRNRKELEGIKEHFHKQISDLQSRLDQSEKDAKNYLSTIGSKDHEIEKIIREHKSELLREKLHWTSLETELREKITDLHRDIDTLQRTREHDKQQAQHKISQFEANQEEWLEKQIDTEKQITGFEDSIQELKVQLQKKEKQITNNGGKDDVIKDLNKQIKNLEKQVSSEQEIVAELQDQLNKMNKNLHSCTDEKDSALLRNAQLSQEYESFKRKSKDQQGDLETELQQKNHSIAGLEQVLQDMQYEAEQNKQKIQDLESQQMVAITEIESEEIKTLQKEVRELEDQLLDRNKTIKKLQHRMADLKKTLQRELNVQALPNDEDPTTGKTSNNKLTINGAGGHSRNGSATLSSKDIGAIHHSSNNLSPYQNTDYGSRTGNTGHLPVSSSVTVNVDRRKYYDGASDFSGSDMENLVINNSTTNNKRNNMKNSTYNPTTTAAFSKDFPNSTNTYAGVHYERDVNFDYLKHVIMKFMLSRETESVHLVKAVAMLLDFSQDEQKMIKDTLEYKMSWFGTRPASLGQGQFSKDIPPSM